MAWRNKIGVLFGICIGIAFSGCVKYSFKGALPPDLKTIAIPLFEDHTNWAGLREDLTNKVIDAFVADNTLQVVEDENNADLILYGTIVGLEERYPSITRQEQVRETQIWLRVKINCYNTHTKKPLWQGEVKKFATIQGAGTLQEKNEKISEIADLIVKDIVNKTISAW